MASGLFRVDTGVHVGLGHLQRSLALSTALRQGGVESFFFSNRENDSHQALECLGMEIAYLSQHESWTPTDVEETFEEACRNDCDFVVVDSHQASSDYLCQLRSAGLFVIARDDLARICFPCHMVVNGNADANQLAYHSSSGDTVFLLGLEYIVLREEFWQLPSRTMRDDVSNILVTVGGTDSQNLMPRCLRLLSELPDDFAVTAIVGPFFQNVAEVKTAVEDARHPVRLVYSPDSVQELMLEADLAISAGGQTLYELARVGCPTLAVRTASDQGRQLKALAKAGAVRAVGDAGDPDMITALRLQLVSLLRDPEARADLANTSQRLVDGEGALRVAQRILSETGHLRTGSSEVGG